MKNLLILLLLSMPLFAYSTELKAKPTPNNSEQSEEFKEFQEFKRMKKSAPASSSEVNTNAVASPAKPNYYSLSAEDRAILAKGEIDSGQYIAGGIVGTIFGLGIGHAIQGRYSEKGWIFTVGELVAATLYIGGLNDCVYQTFSGARSCSVSTAGSIGAVALFGLRIWEIVDVWVAPPSQNAQYKRVKAMSENHPLSFFAVPSPRAGDGLASIELGLQYRF